MARKTVMTGLGFFVVISILTSIAFADSMLSWQAVPGTVTGYRVYYGTTPTTFPSNRDVGNSTQYALSNLSLSQGLTYYFVIRAYNSAGESANSNVVSWTVPDTTPPLPPIGVSCQSGSSTLQWSANTEPDLREYRVYYGTSAGNYSPFISVGRGTTYSVPNLLSGTTYYFALTAVDNSGNESSYSAVVSSRISDSQAPAVTISLPTTASTYTATTNTIGLSGTASDNIGVTTVTWANSLGGSGTANGTNSWTVANVSLASGDNRITVRAIDAAGNSAEKILTVSYIPPVVTDTTAPTVTITSPTNNTTYSTSTAAISVSGTASDNIGVTQVAWSNSRGGSGQATGTTSWSIANITLIEGTNGITVTARDAAGNITQKILTVTYTIPDTTGPVVAITTPSAGGTYQTGIATLNLSGTASDNRSVAQVRWANDRGGSGTASGTTAWTISGVALAEGTNKITVTAADAAGNQGASVITVTYTAPDTIDPSISIVSPTTAGTYTTTNAALNLSGSASDNVGVTQIRWTNSRGGSGIATGTQNWSVTGISLLEGQNLITVTGGDAAGNSSSRTLTVTYNVPDTTRPVVLIVAPTTNATYGTTAASINLTGTAGDNVGVTQVAWTNSRGGTGVASGTTSWSASNITLYVGENVITVTARDQAGNTGSDSITISYTLPDTTAPVIRRRLPTTGSRYVTRMTTINVSGTASDNVGVAQVLWSNSTGGSGTATGTTSWSVTGIRLVNGTNRITITALDRAGNRATNTLSVTKY